MYRTSFANYTSKNNNKHLKITVLLFYILAIQTDKSSYTYVGM